MSIHKTKLNKKVRLSLSRNRLYATNTSQISKDLLPENSDTELRSTLLQGLRLLEEELFEHFPENIFADFDLLIAHIITKAKQTYSPSKYLMERCEFISKLFALYGSNSIIRFQYVHDFIYGFDWARWVQKSPNLRGNVGPFDRVFLDHLFLRGNEICTLIKKNNAKYPKLASHKMRNPFPFSRSPQDEILLHGTLAKKNLIPVTSWSINGKFSHAWDFHKKRIDQANILNKNKVPELVK